MSQEYLRLFVLALFLFTKSEMELLPEVECMNNESPNNLRLRSLGKMEILRKS